MIWWLSLLLYAATTYVLGLLSPRPKPDTPQPGSLGDFNVPTAEEGRALPVIFGTCHLKGPNVTWYGDLSAYAIKKKQKTSLFTSTEQTIGYRYHLTVDYALCAGPVDAILDVRWEDKSPGFAASDVGTYRHLVFEAQTLFGDREREGGVAGTIDVYYGGFAQGGDAYLQGVVGATLPGQRGVCHAVAKHFYFGNSPYLKAISFVVKRLPNSLGLTGGAHDIAGDANPAAMVYEMLTDSRWGLGLPSGAIDAASFLAAGQTLATEALGLSMVFDTATTASDAIGEILRHVDGVIYADPTTGFLTMQLARLDYSVPALPVFDPSNVLECTFSRPGWAETKNSVRVRYIDRAGNYSDRVAAAQDLASIQIRGGEVASEDFNFRGLTNAAAAQKVAARVLKGVSYPFAQVRLVVNRQGWALRPGDVFRLTWPPLGITDMVCRVTRPQTGELRDGRIRLEAVEDAFAVTWTGYSAPGGTQWQDPLAAPQALAAQRLLEAPYSLAEGPNRRVVTLGVRAVGHALGYQVWSDPAGGTAYAFTNSVPALTPSGTLVSPLSPTATSFVLQNPVDCASLDSITAADLALGRNVLLVDEELIGWQTATDNGDGTWTIGGLVRGEPDTTPKTHFAGARVWFLTEGAGLTSPDDYVADLTVTAKLLPFNGRGTLAIGSASQVSASTSGRTLKPYVPAAVRENGTAYPTNVADALAVSWSHRNRLGSWEWDDAGVAAGLEAGCTYRVKVYGEGGGLVHTESGITGTSWTYALATEITEGELGRPNDRLRVVVEAVNGTSGAVSHQAYDHTCDAAGYGLRYGDYYGGQAG